MPQAETSMETSSQRWMTCSCSLQPPLFGSEPPQLHRVSAGSSSKSLTVAHVECWWKWELISKATVVMTPSLASLYLIIFTQLGCRIEWDQARTIRCAIIQCERVFFIFSEHQEWSQVVKHAEKQEHNPLSVFLLLHWAACARLTSSEKLSAPTSFPSSTTGNMQLHNFTLKALFAAVCCAQSHQ